MLAGMKRTRELELDFVRVISMIMIIFCHMSAEAGVKWGGYFNVGVMIFMFMSGYLSYRAEYDKKWISGRLKRILPEYYFFLVLYLIVTMVFFRAEYSLKQIFVNLFLLQGLFTESSLPNILHLWFVTYILICYILTPFAVRLIKKYDRNRVVIFALVLQIVVIPLRVVGINIYFSRFVAYFAGLYLAMNQENACKEVQYKNVMKQMAIPVVLVNAIRISLELSGLQEKMPRIAEMALSLIWQWAHMFLGIFLFYLLWCFGHTALNRMNRTGKEVLLHISSRSYCAYIVHQVFVYHEYAITRYVGQYLFGAAIALLCIAISTQVLFCLSNCFRYIVNKDRR